MITMDEARHGPVTVLMLGGPLDSGNATVLETRLASYAVTPAVVVDLAAVDYLSGSCLRVLLRAARHMDADGRRLVLCAPRPHVLDVLRISGLNRAIHIHADRAAALAELGETG